MGVIVQKYGGTSVGSLEKIKFVAGRVAKRYQEGNDVAVVVSAMSGETDKLIKMARELSPSPDPREMDVLVSTGEQITIALLSMALKDIGIPARSLLGFQIGIRTDDAFMKARIQDIDTSLLKEVFAAREVAVIAGFQGISNGRDFAAVKAERALMRRLEGGCQVPVAAIAEVQAFFPVQASSIFCQRPPRSGSKAS